MKKTTLFTLIAVSIPVLFFLSLEYGLRWANYRGNTELFIHPPEFPDYKTINRNFASRYFFNTSVIPTPIHDFFLKEKPENGLRVFVMGGSSAAGYPYPANGVFSRVTRDALQDVLPNTTVEFVNVATSAINSYTLYDQAKEIIEQQPDAILIYAGHNEYYGALGVGSVESLGAFPGFVRFYLGIQRLKTFMLLRDGINRIGKWFGSIGRGDEPVQVETLMQQVVREQIIPLDSPIYHLGVRQYESNMRALLKIFNEAGVPVYIGSLVSNERDFEPFESVPTENHPPAGTVFTRANELRSRGQLDSAKTQYTYAKDLDALRFRAPSDMNRIVKKLADEGLATYVPVNETLSDAAADGVIGYDLMLEHLHPNHVGYHLIGMAYFRTIQENGFFGHQADLSRLRSDEQYASSMRLTELDHRIVAHRMTMLTNNWPFKKGGEPFRFGNYRHTSVADSFAFEVVANQIRWDMAKVELAEYYRKRRMISEAMAEFDGLMRDQYFSDSPFVFAARALLDAGYLDSAEPYLLRAHEIEPSAFTTKMLGAIEVDRGNFAKGVEWLLQSLEMNPKDPQAKYNLSGAYAQSGELAKALDIAREILRETPSFPGIQDWVAQLEQLVN